MQKKRIFGLCGVLLLVAVGVLAYVKPGQARMTTIAATQNEAAKKKTATDAAKSETAIAENEIRRLLERYYEIARTGDREALKNFSRDISAADYRYSSELGVMDKQATLRHSDALDLKFVNPAFEDLTVQVHGADVAIAKYLDASTVKINGVLMTKPTRFTNVWVKENGAWKIVAEHSSLTNPRELLPRNRFADNLAKK